ncbi:hypothetical protein MKW98_005832 [Papaver atlanticum]|uniref:Uncharacterized protein n=1 Tax=Papaver atlanticum TaxID=357466 RepID=A0AAD4XVX4_9MAGN|nr:hypothetical protein MKW98_005832 [Papaver atlanticum]
MDIHRYFGLLKIIRYFPITTLEVEATRKPSTQWIGETSLDPKLKCHAYSYVGLCSNFSFLQLKSYSRKAMAKFQA